MKLTRRIRLIVTAITVLIMCFVATACSSPSQQSDTDAHATTIRLGYFDNVTHAPALVGINQGFFASAFGSTTFQTQIFNAGPAAIEALSSGAVDAVYIGPSPAINSYVKSSGASLVIVSGVAVGGAGLVVASDITSAKDLAGKTLGTPQLGNTQDVALRTWLTLQGYTVSLEGGGDVTVAPAENATNFDLFKSGQIQGAWVPEPWLSRYVSEGGGHVLVDESSLWPDGIFPTTELAVNKDFFNKYPATVKELVQANVDSINWITTNPSQVGTVINDVLKKDTGKTLKQDVLDSALERITFTWNPEAQTFTTLLNNAVALNLAKKGSLVGLVQLASLNQILTASGNPSVDAAGLG